jgi:hypothetical protein
LMIYIKWADQWGRLLLVRREDSANAAKKHIHL